MRPWLSRSNGRTRARFCQNNGDISKKQAFLIYRVLAGRGTRENTRFVIAPIHPWTPSHVFFAPHHVAKSLTVENGSALDKLLDVPNDAQGTAGSYFRDPQAIDLQRQNITGPVVLQVL